MSFIANEPNRAQIVEHLIEATDLALVRHSNDEETFIECILCYKWEEHEAGCPIPAIEAWLKIPEPGIEF